MTFERLIAQLDEAYPSGSLAKAAGTLPGGDGEGVPCDDHLAVAVVSGIYYSFDEAKSDRDQLVAAFDVVTHGKNELDRLARALWRAADEAAWKEKRL